MEQMDPENKTPESAISISEGEFSSNALTRTFQKTTPTKNGKKIPSRSSDKKKKARSKSKILSLFVLTLLIFVAIASTSIFISLCGKLPKALKTSSSSLNLQSTSRRLFNMSDDQEVYKKSRSSNKKKYSVIWNQIKRQLSSVNEMKYVLSGLDRNNINALVDSYQSKHMGEKTNEKNQSIKTVIISDDFLMTLKNLRKDPSFSYKNLTSRRLSDNEMCEFDIPGFDGGGGDDEEEGGGVDNEAFEDGGEGGRRGPGGEPGIPTVSGIVDGVGGDVEGQRQQGPSLFRRYWRRAAGLGCAVVVFVLLIIFLWMIITAVQSTDVAPTTGGPGNGTGGPPLGGETTASTTPFLPTTQTPMTFKFD